MEERESSIDKANTGLSVEEYIRIFIKYKKTILITTGVAFVFSIVLYFFIINPVYYSTSTVKTSSKIGGVADLLSGGAIPDIGGLGDLAGVGASVK